MFELPINPFIFLLHTVTAASQATPAELESIKFRFYNGDSMASYVETLGNESLKFWHQQNATKPIFIYVPGWHCINHTSNIKTRTAVIGALIKSCCCNVWEMIWDEISCNPYYPYAAASVDSVGGVLAEFINAHMRNGWDPAKIISVGHSLGCHICGLAGRKTDFLIAWICGLDCAGPLFTDQNKYRYNNSAKTVHVMHTDSSFFGSPLVLGQVDLYPNKGERLQPMCDIFSIPGCSHEAACLFFGAETEKPYSLMARTCDSWDNWDHHECDSNPIVDIGWMRPSSESGKYYLVVPDIPPGKYYFRTSGTWPYGLGEDGATSSTSSSSLVSPLLLFLLR